MLTRMWLIAAIVISTAMGLWGVRAMEKFDLTAGVDGEPPLVWPAGSSIRRTPDRPTLLLFAHPMCTCSRATVAELGKVLALAEGPLQVRILMEPEGAGDHPDLWNAAAQLPSAELAWDKQGREAMLFGAKTSGLVLLYARGGRLLFEGGVTAARGHEGGNRGADALLASLQQTDSAFHKFLVFGCALRGTRS